MGLSPGFRAHCILKMYVTRRGIISIYNVVHMVCNAQFRSFFYLFLISLQVDFNEFYNTFTKGSPYEGHSRHSGLWYF